MIDLSDIHKYEQHYDGILTTYKQYGYSTNSWYVQPGIKLNWSTFSLGWYPKYTVINKYYDVIDFKSLWISDIYRIILEQS